MSSTSPRASRRPNVRSSAGFLAVHALALLVVVTGVTRTALVLLVVTYVVRQFCITAGFHRYFSHRSYQLGRTAQLVLAFGGSTACQRGPLWWATHHRVHHRFTDVEGDMHSPREGFWWSHVGWLLCDRFDVAEHPPVKDFDRHPEIGWLDRHPWVAPWALGVACFAIGGPSGLVVGFFGSTVLLWHGTFLVNSVAHVWGRQRFATGDTSRNNALVALLTGGEGWHNNHHRYPSSARQGFYWWELDSTYLVLRALAAVGVVRGLRQPPARVLEEGRRGAAAPPADDDAPELVGVG
jgi:stearoyl-CoA desaturase (delta-9 desaturase)